MRLRRSFTKEFKRSVLRELAVKKLAEVCREHSLHSSVIRRWEKEYSKNPKEAFSGYGNPWKDDAKLSHYERLVGQLYAENAFLKKALDALKGHLAEEKRKER